MRCHRKIALATIIVASALVSSVEGDEIQLRGGGSVQGFAVADPDRPGFLRIYTSTAETPISIQEERVASIVTGETPLREYVERLATLPNTPEAHLALAQWCDSVGLRGPAQTHYAATVKLDPENGEAHQKLGHVFWDGQWRTYDQVREAQGLVKYRGQWLTPEEQARIQSQERDTTAQKKWSLQIQAWIRDFQEGTPTERQRAERNLLQIQDRDAIVPLVNLLGEEPTELRIVLAQVLGTISDSKAADGLIYRILAEHDGQIRQMNLNQLAQRSDPGIVPGLTRALADKDPERVGRAAWALAGLNASEAVPRLVPELLSKEKRIEVVMAPVESGGNGFNVGFSQVQGVGQGPGTGFIGTSPSIPVLTGPVTAPGVVAFGVTATPIVSGAGFSTGGPAGNVQVQPRQVVVPYLHRNTEVLAALERLTGKNFGYDVEAWKRWLRTDFQPPTPDQPARRVPQP